ncbi:MAG TPA: hypothetical protein VH475_17235 [Tepidisphaeraceae bacterium]
MNNRANIRRGLSAIAAIACYGAAVYCRAAFTGPYPFVHGLMEPYAVEMRARLATLTCALAFFIPVHYLIGRLLSNVVEEAPPASPAIPSRARDPLMYLATMPSDPGATLPTRRRSRR